MSPILLLAVSPFLFFLSSVSATLGIGLGLVRSSIFLSCFSLHSPPFTPVNRLIFSVYAPSYSNIFHASIQNLRFNSSDSPTPTFIITPEAAIHVRAAVICTKEHGLEVRVRSGGHDYEGLSYKANVPFVLIDLVNLRKVSVDPERGIATVQSGATLGELYYWISNKTRICGFPAGTCPTIGIGGHFCGGGKGTLTRKYGLASDNVVDAVLVKADGQIVNRKAMGEDLFWAIRGGGGGSFGIVVEWTIKLVPVPTKVTMFNVAKTLEEGATRLVHKWQQIAHRLDDDLFIRATILVTQNPEGRKTIMVSFSGLFLGTTEELLPVITATFPELDVGQEDCRELSWIESVVAFDGSYPTGETTEVLLDRNHITRSSFKAKSDFVTKPISVLNLENIWRVMKQGKSGIMILDPYGGRMSQILESATPFPHRFGTLYSIQYFTNWVPGSAETEREHLEWINRMYNFMGPFVSKKPRASYVNYRDLDLGVNGNGGYNEAKQWGESYFKGNFARLAKIKGQADPENFFRSEQSIPLP